MQTIYIRLIIIIECIMVVMYYQLRYSILEQILCQHIDIIIRRMLMFILQQHILIIEVIQLQDIVLIEVIFRLVIDIII